MDGITSIRERAARGRYDAVVVGAGPNGLAAAVMLAQRGASVLLLEAAATVGGGCRTAELTLPGLRHDVCSAIHPLGAGSPFFRTLPLDKFGLEWLHPDIPLAHPFDDGPPALLSRSIVETGETLGDDGLAYRRLIGPLTPDWDELCAALLNPLRMARYPLGLARFGLPSLLSSRGLTDLVFRGARAKAFFSGLAAHAVLPLDKPITAAFGLVLAITGHVLGWPVARGGSQSIADALAGYFQSLGGEILTDAAVQSFDDLPESRVILCDIGPRRFVDIARDRVSVSYRNKLLSYRYGPAAFKVDWALDGPVPWKDPDCARAGTIHLGPTRAEIARSESDAWTGSLSEAPFVLVAQQSLFDPSRRPITSPQPPPSQGGGVTDTFTPLSLEGRRAGGEGPQALWAYCHVPAGYDGDATGRIESQIERFAPGFRDRILARHVYTPATFEQYNANYVGGDINGGVLDLAQLYARPALRAIPYETPIHGVYLCSASTPPGGGVHGMCGYYAALAALRDLK